MVNPSKHQTVGFSKNILKSRLSILPKIYPRTLPRISKAISSLVMHHKKSSSDSLSRLTAKLIIIQWGALKMNTNPFIAAMENYSTCNQKELCSHQHLSLIITATIRKTTLRRHQLNTQIIEECPLALLHCFLDPSLN